MINMKIKTSILSLTALAALTACNVPPRLEDAQYWQRKNATSALYLRGPKAQQTLHKDIADCTNEIAELARLGPIREAIPADTRAGRVPAAGSPEAALAKWDTPKRDGALYSEHFNYTDFEACMDYKGWERIEQLPFDQAIKARGDYLTNVYGYKFQSNNPRPAMEKSADAYQSMPDVTVNN